MAANDLSHADLLKAFEARYDYLSARTVAGEVLTASGVGKKDGYAAAEVKSIVAAVQGSLGASGQSIVDALGAPAPAPAAKAEPAKEAPAKAPAKDDAKDDAKDEKAAPAKADEKKEAAKPAADAKKPAGKK